MLVLGAVAGAAVIAYAVSGSDDEQPVEAQVFASVDNCVASGESQTECVARYNQALAANTASAPRFANREDCERDFGAGQCQAAPAEAASGQAPSSQTASSGQTASPGSSFFMPMMMGFLAARMMSGGSQQAYPAQPVYGCAGGGPAPAARPGFAQRPACYNNRYGQRYTFVGGMFSRATTVPASSFRSSAPNQVARGGSVSAFRPSTNPGSSVMARGGFGSSGRSSGFFGGG